MKTRQKSVQTKGYTYIQNFYFNDDLKKSSNYKYPCIHDAVDTSSNKPRNAYTTNVLLTVILSEKLCNIYIPGEPADTAVYIY